MKTVFEMLMSESCGSASGQRYPNLKPLHNTLVQIHNLYTTP